MQAVKTAISLIMFMNSLLFRSFSHYIGYNNIRYFYTRLPMGESNLDFVLHIFLCPCSHMNTSPFLVAKEAPITEDAANAVDHLLIFLTSFSTSWIFEVQSLWPSMSIRSNWLCHCYCHCILFWKIKVRPTGFTGLTYDGLPAQHFSASAVIWSW